VARSLVAIASVLVLGGCVEQTAASSEPQLTPSPEIIVKEPSVSTAPSDVGIQQQGP
jgi:uncharacterized lipoprotein YajG